MKKRIFAIFITVCLTALAVFSFAACKENPDPTDPVGGDKDGDTVSGGVVTMVSRISIDLSDDPLQLPYALTGGDGPVVWTSDYASVAAVTETGMLYPVAVGIAEITAATANSSTTFEVNVTDTYRSYTKLKSVSDVENLIKNKGYTKAANRYCLTRDIDFEGKTISPLGAWGDNNSAFNATIDGRGYALKNFVIDKPEECKTVNESTGAEEYFGVCLFPYIGKGTVRNLNLIGVNFTGYGFIGGVAGQNESGTVENCFVQGVINAESGFASSVPAGGVCGIIGSGGKVANNFIDLDILGGFVFAGFDFGSGGNCVARENSITAYRQGNELMFQTDDTGKTGPEGEAENKQLTEFKSSKVLKETQLTDLKNYGFTDDSNWAIMRGYMAFIARPDGTAPDWAKINIA